MVILVCEVEGDPTPLVTWRFNGTVIRNPEGITIASSPGMSRVRILTSRLSNAGPYTCFATNDAATVNSTIRLEIQSECTFISFTTKCRKYSIGLHVFIYVITLEMHTCRKLATMSWTLDIFIS